jgi:signal peptidase I
MPEQVKKSGLRETFESLVVTVILALFGTTFVVQAFKIPSGSMENTLLVGDHLLVNRIAFAWQFGALRHVGPYREPERQQVLVFKFPGNDAEAQEPGEHLVKRIIGVPGDHIRILHRQVFVNGQPLNEPYAHHDYPNEVMPGDDFPPPPGEYLRGSTPEWSQDLQNHVENGELVVPAGEYFVMGDNREHSWDSRFWGFVPRPLASGQPLLIYWSFETPEEEYTETSLSDRLSQTADLLLHFFSKTRWRRTFHIVR